MRSSSGVRALVKSAPAQRLIQTQRAARVLSPSDKFVASQLARRRVGRYQLRLTGAALYLRHNSRDIEILNEIFGGTGGRRSYAPPAPVTARLDRGDPLRVLDLGGNIGLFGLDALSRWNVAGMRSFEPDPPNAALLRATIRDNGLQDRWVLEQAAVSNQNGHMRFVTGLLAEAHMAGGSEDGIEVPMLDLYALDHDVDLMKMDIEGGEWAILTDPRLAGLRAKVLVIEWHTRFCPERDAHAAVLRLLTAAGYSILQDIPEDHMNNGVLWAARV